MDPVVWGFLGTLVVTAGGWFVNQRKLKADIEVAKAEADRARAEAVKLRGDTDSVVLSAVAKVTQAMQDTYQEIINDVTAQVVAAKQEAMTAGVAAREAKVSAQEAENQAWLAEMRARAMERFLAELRPLIASHIPNSEAILERLDKLTTARP